MARLDDAAFEECLQLAAARGVAQFAECFRLDLATALAGDREVLANLFEGVLVALADAETHLDLFGVGLLPELLLGVSCGLPCRGFARLKCEGCDESRLVAFSCKGRGFCPSCMGRRMNATAANLIERVPGTGLRQWVLTFPFAWQGRLAQDGALRGNLTRIFVETVHTFYADRAAREGHDTSLCASLAGFTRANRAALDLTAKPRLFHLQSFVRVGDFTSSPPRFCLTCCGPPDRAHTGAQILASATKEVCGAAVLETDNEV